MSVSTQCTNNDISFIQRRVAVVSCICAWWRTLFFVLEQYIIINRDEVVLMIMGVCWVLRSRISASKNYILSLKIWNFLHIMPSSTPGCVEWSLFWELHTQQQHNSNWCECRKRTMQKSAIILSSQTHTQNRLFFQQQQPLFSFTGITISLWITLKQQNRHSFSLHYRSRQTRQLLRPITSTQTYHSIIFKLPNTSTSNPTMSQNQHAPLLSLSITTTLFLLVTYKSHELIGFLYGPSSQLFATKQQFIQSNLLARIYSTDNDDNDQQQTTIFTTLMSWMTNMSTTAEQIYNPHYELAYQHHYVTCILRDAGMIAAMFAVLRACNFFASTATNTTNSSNNKTNKIMQRWYHLFMAVSLFILPGMIGQLLLSKSVPVEILLLNRFNNNNVTTSSFIGILEGIMYMGYCSLKSLSSLGEEGVYHVVLSSVGNVVYELKVVGVALALVVFFLGWIHSLNRKREREKERVKVYLYAAHRYDNSTAN